VIRNYCGSAIPNDSERAFNCHAVRFPTPSPTHAFVGGKGNIRPLAILAASLGAPRLSSASRGRMREGSDMANNKLTILARILRRNQTEIEGRLWQHLRNRRLGGFKFRRQHPVIGYILDFYCPEKRLAVELDGSQHDLPDQMDHDQNRTNALENEGIKVIRYWDNEVLQNLDGILEDILAELENRKVL
jgi:very-short-patch-repair endonuclease